MNIYITAAVKELKEKLNAYLSLLSYRYANLCVKAELGALLPVTCQPLCKSRVGSPAARHRSGRARL